MLCCPFSFIQQQQQQQQIVDDFKKSRNKETGIFSTQL